MIKNKKAVIPVMNPKILISVAVIILIVVGLNIGFKTGQISVGGKLPEVRNEVWNGLDIKLTSPAFGTIKNTIGNEFCSSGSGDVEINNVYVVSKDLMLASSISGSERKCHDNSLIAEAEFPVGKLFGTCDIGASETSSGVSYASCQLKKGGSELYSNWINVNERGERTTGGSREFELIIDEPTKIEMIVNSGVGRTGSGGASMNLRFVALTQEEAEEEIIEQAAETQEPQTQPPLQKKNIFDYIQDLINWILGLFKR